MKKTTTILAMLLVLALLIVGCSSQGQEPGGEVQTGEKIIKIGASVPLTGGMAYEGKLFEKGYKFWAEKVNEKGGIKIDSEDYKVEVVLYDDKSDAQTAAKLTEKLITEDKVDFLLSPFSSTLTFATSAIAEKYGKINIVPVANAEDIYNRGYKYVFGILPLAEENVGMMLEMAKEKDYDVKTVAIVSPDEMYPLAAAEGAKAKAEELGYEVVAFIKYPADASDLSTVVSQIRNLKPDIVIGTPHTEGSMPLAKSFYEQKVKPKMIGMQDVAAMPEFLGNLGMAAEGITSTTWWTKDLTWNDSLFGTAANFAEEWKDKYGEYPPSAWPAAAVAGADVLRLAIEKAGTVETEQVREAMLQLDVETLFLPIRFGDAGDCTQVNVAGRPVVLQVLDQKVEVVYPDKVKAKDHVYPMETK